MFLKNVNVFKSVSRRYLVYGELRPQVWLRPLVVHVFADDGLHPQQLQLVRHIVERVLVRERHQSLRSTRRSEFVLPNF